MISALTVREGSGKVTLLAVISMFQNSDDSEVQSKLGVDGAYARAFFLYFIVVYKLWNKNVQGGNSAVPAKFRDGSHL